MSPFNGQAVAILWVMSSHSRLPRPVCVSGPRTCPSAALHEKGTLGTQPAQGGRGALLPAFSWSVLVESLVSPLCTLKGEMEKEAGLGILRSKRKPNFYTQYLQDMPFLKCVPWLPPRPFRGRCCVQVVKTVSIIILRCFVPVPFILSWTQSGVF